MANAPLPSQADAPEANARQGGPTATCEVTGQTLPLADTTVLFGQRVGAEGKQRLLEQWQWNRGSAIETSANEQPCRPWDRIGAAAADTLTMFMLAGCMLVVWIVFDAFTGLTRKFDVSGGQIHANRSMLFAHALLVFPLTILPVLYMSISHARPAQSTLGKSSMGAKLITLSNRPVGIVRAFWRAAMSHGFWWPTFCMQLFWLHQIDTSGWLFQGSKHLGWMHGVLTDWPWLVFLSCLLIPAFNVACLFVSPNRRMLHDVLAGTKVVQAKQGV